MRLRARRWSIGRRTGVDTVTKPPKWGWSQGNLHEPHKSIASGMTSLFPIWDSPGAPADVVTPAITITLASGVVYVDDVGGKALDFNAGGPLPTSAGIGTVPNTRSVMAVFTPKVYPTGDLFKGVWGIHDGAFLLCDIGFDDRGLLLFYEVTGGTVNLFSPANSIHLDQRHCAVCTTSNANGMRMYLDGALVNSNAVTGFLTDGASKKGTPGLNSSPFVAGNGRMWLSMFGYWTRELTSTEAIALSLDPFGLVRQ
jgi:hypothetical protein